MPELPDVEIFSKNLDKIFSGHTLLEVKVVNGKKLADSSRALSSALVGKTLKKIYRSGKEMRFSFNDDVLLGLHLMLTGDIFVFEKKNDHKFTIIEFYFENAKGIALTDRMRNANVRLNPTDKDGIDALSKEFNFKYLKKILQRKTIIKNILMDQNFIRGIGNSYSDEILWSTRISPYSIAEKIPQEKVKELAAAIKRILNKEIKQIDRTYPGITSGEIKDFLQIHTKSTNKSPTGAPIKIDSKGKRKTYYTDEQILYN